MKVAQDIDLDSKTVRLTTDNKITVDYSHNTGLILNTENIAETIQQARDNNLSIVDMRKQTIRLTEDISFRHLNVVLPNTYFVLVQRDDGSYPIIELGGNSNSTDNPEQVLGKVLRSTFDHKQMSPKLLTDEPSIKVLGAKNQSITVKQCDYIRLELQNTTDASSIAYSDFNFNFVQRLEISPRAEDMEVGLLWCNENLFNIRRLYGLDMKGKYMHNNNLFVGASTDYKDSYINIQSGRNNRFTNFRMEELQELTFSSHTELNVIEQSWVSSMPRAFEIGIKHPTVVDEGLLNRFNFNVPQHSHSYRVCLKTGDLSTTRPWAEVYTSPKFEVKSNEDLVILDWNNTEARYLIVAEFYDENGTKIIPNDFVCQFLRKNESKNRLEGNYAGGQHYGTRYFILKDPRVVSMTVALYSNSDLSKQLSTRFTCDLFASGVRMMNVS